MAADKVCQFFKHGYCHFGSICRNRHVHDVCEDSGCNVKTCELRHPRLCIFYKEFKQCRFGSLCLFKHDFHQSSTSECNAAVMLQTKVKEIEEKYEYIIKKLDDIITDVNHFKVIDSRKEFIVNDDGQDTARTVAVLQKKLIDVEAKQDLVISDIESISMVTDSQQQQADGFKKELSTYSQAVAALNVKVSQVVNEVFQHRTLRPGDLSSKQVTSSPSPLVNQTYRVPPTPPSSSSKLNGRF